MFNAIPPVAHRRLRVAVLALLAGLATTTPALADSANLDQYGASESMRDGFAVSRPRTPGHLVPGAVLHLDYGNDPLVVEQNPGDTDSEAAAVVKHLMTSHLGLSLGLGDSLMVFGGFRASLINAGDAFPGAPPADGRGFGDSFLGGRLHLFGDDDDAVALGGQVTVNFPTAKLANDSQNFTGDSFGSVVPEALLELRPGRLRINAVAGVRLREAATFNNVEIGQEMLYTLGLTYPVVQEVFDLHAEVYGATTFAHFFARESTPLEAIGGAKYYFGQCFTAGAAGGLGVLRGYGAPDLRVVGTLGWEGCPPPKVELPDEPPVIDTDMDGLLDPDDACPYDPEDKDDFEDADGCPDPDNDSDGVLDVDDQCVLEPEDADDFEDEDGCPDPDNDDDGVLDGDDRCPNDPEDKDDFEDEDGCPDPDNDNDSVLDTVDECPLEPGKPKDKGCPRTIRVEEGRIVILERVEFATGKDRILSRSEAILEEVQATLAANPRITLLRIEGHTDSRGRDKKNLDLSRRRARSVARWLVERGIDAERFEAWGCGETRPVGNNKTSEGRQQNRRVEFHILDNAGEAPSTETCEEIEL